MRAASFLTLAVLILGALPVAGPASAQLPGGDVYYEGLLHHPLGAATLDLPSPAARRLPVHNLGSSGEDGVEVALAAGSGGLSLLFDTSTDFDLPGSSDALELHGTLDGVPDVVVARLSATCNSDGSEGLTADFTGAGASGCWVVLLDASGAVAGRQFVAPHILEAVTSPGPLPTAARGGNTSGTRAPDRALISGLKRTGELIEWRSSGDARIVVRYASPVLVDGTVCSALQFIGKTSHSIGDLSSVRLTCAMPSGSGSVAIAEAGIVPPCAGCPNGPDDAGLLVALGEARYGGFGGGGAGGEIRLDNLGSSGQDGVSVIGERGCCFNDELGVSISDATQSSPADLGTVQFDSRGTLGGVSDQPLGYLACTFEGTDWSFVPDFSPIGATGYRVLLYLGGVQIGDIPNPASGVRRWGDGHVTLMKITDDSEEYRIVCIVHPCPGSPVMVDGAEYLADEVVMRPTDPAPGSLIQRPDDIASMSLRSTGANTMTITGSNFHSSAPTVSVNQPAPAADFAAPRLSPNPASGPVSVVFALPQAGHARVSVIDVSGRQVRGLADGSFTAGAHDLRWDGRDDAGRPASAGVYFVRVEAGTATRVARVTRLW